jgi:hypothetical protein
MAIEEEVSACKVFVRTSQMSDIQHGAADIQRRKRLVATEPTSRADGKAGRTEPTELCYSIMTQMRQGHFSDRSYNQNNQMSPPSDSTIPGMTQP